MTVCSIGDLKLAITFVKAPNRLWDGRHRLTKVLAEGPPRTSRGEAVRFSISADEMEDADRRSGNSWADSPRRLTRNLGEDDLEQTLEALRVQRAMSTARLAVFSVHDALQDELNRRYREGPSAVQPR